MITEKDAALSDMEDRTSDKTDSSGRGRMRNRIIAFHRGRQVLRRRLHGAFLSVFVKSTVQLVVEGARLKEQL